MSRAPHMADARVLWIIVIMLRFDDSQTLQNVTAKAGKSCVLWSRGPSNTDVMVLRCRQEKHTPYVFLYRDGRAETAGQDPSFSKRVKLLHSDFSNGDLSLVIMNVTFEDSGTYECKVQTSDEREEVSRISLKVLPDGEEMAGHEEKQPTDAGDPGDSVWGSDALISACVVGLLAVAVTVLGVMRFNKRQTLAEREKSTRPSEEELLSA